MTPYTLTVHRACPDIPFSWMMSEAHCSSTDMFAKMVTIWKMELRSYKINMYNSHGALWRQVSWGLQNFPSVWLRSFCPSFHVHLSVCYLSICPSFHGIVFYSHVLLPPRCKSQWLTPINQWVALGWLSGAPSRQQPHTGWSWGPVVWVQKPF